MTTLPSGKGVAMRSIGIGLFVFALLSAGMAGGWYAMNTWAAGSVGTPAPAGAISNGHPEDCTNVNFTVMPRKTASRTVLLEQGQTLRGTFEVNGGFARVDIILRIVSPQGLDLLASPKSENYDFTLTPKIRGEYTFIFDNRYSLFTSKAVGLFYCLDRTTPGLPPG
jgi:hypothetical protein